MQFTKNLKWTGVLLTSIVLLSLMLCTGAVAEKKQDGKSLVIRTNKPVPTQMVVQTVGQLQVAVTPNQKKYKVGDTFSLHVSGNQNFFLWIFAMNENAGRGRMLVPGVVQTGNRYNANQTYKVPVGGSYELFMDKSGFERIVVVASTKWIAIDSKKLQKNKYFYSTSYKGLETQLKGLRLLPSQGQAVRTASDVVVTELNLLVTGNATVAARPVVAPVAVPVAVSVATPIMAVPGFTAVNDKSVVFVSQDKDAYRLGEMVIVAYGATKAGWISLFVQYPNGKAEFLKKEYVDGKSIYTLQAEAVSPMGSQNLMAVFSADKKAQFPVGNIHLYTDYFVTGKGLRLLPAPQKRPTYNISRFTIQ